MRRREREQSARPAAWQLALLLVLAWDVLNLGYLFQGTMIPLGEFPFQSETLSGVPVLPEGDEQGPRGTGNRFAGTWLGSLPVPLPWDYVIGLDVQKLDFEKRKWSYLCGEHRLGGWWYYYVAALALKAPLGYWLIAAVAVWYSLRHAQSAIPRADRLVLTIVPLSLFVFISSQTGFSRYLRYLLPAFPFAYIWMGRIGELLVRPGFGAAKALVAAGLLWGFASSLWHYPHSLSYFNELAGGPRHGHRYLTDANISWGHDGYYLRDWIRDHPEARPLSYAYISFFDLGVLGVHGKHTPSLHPDREYSGPEALQAGPQPGWHIVDVNYLNSHRHHYDYFRLFAPVDRVAYSMHVFHLTREEANAARSKLGLPLLPAATPGPH
jgi:hypothetical protein